MLPYIEKAQPVHPLSLRHAIQKLFAPDKQGLFYDPSDFTRYTSVKGPELVTNHGFGAAFADGLWSISGIKFRKVAGSAGRAYIPCTALVAGRSYEVTFDVVATGGGGSCFLRTGQGGPVATANLNFPAGISRQRLITVATGPHDTVMIQPDTTAVLELENISVRELTAIRTASKFQDSIATIPVTSIEQPEALKLDRRLWAPLGDELAVSILSSATGWTFPVAGASVAGGALVFNTPQNVSSNAVIQILTAGKLYKVTFTITGSGTVTVRTGSAGVFTGNLGAGTHTIYGIASGANPKDLSFASAASTVNNFVGSITNISVREIPGNHSSQTTATARPVLSARVNDFIKNDQITWANKTNVTTVPAGLYVAEFDSYLVQMLETTTNGQHNTNCDSGGRVNFVQGEHTTCKFLAKSIGGRNIRIGGPSGAVIDLGVIFDLTNGTVLSKNTGTTATIVPYGDGLYLCTASAMGLQNLSSYVVFSAVDGTTLSFAGDVTKGVFFGAVDFRLQRLFDMHPKYQRSVSNSDYDTVGFPLYDRYDGVDDGQITGPISLGSDMDCFILMRRDTANPVVLAYSGVGSGNFFIAGSTAEFATMGAGTPTYHVNGVAVPGGTAVTRAQLGAALLVGQWCIVEIRNVNMSTWTAFGMGCYNSNQLKGAIGGVVVIPAQSAANRTLIRTYLASLVGVTLP